MFLRNGLFLLHFKQKSARGRRRRISRRPILSPTIRREKSFTAAPFSSPAPNKMRRNFMFARNGPQVDEMSVVKENMNETNVTFTPKEFKKRRVIDTINENNDQQRKRLSFDKMQNKLSCVSPNS